MAGTNFYGPYLVLSSGDMSGDLATEARDFLRCSVGAIELVWTGTPTGTFSIDGSIDNVSDYTKVVNWYPTGTFVAAPAGSSNSTLVNLIGVGFRWLRVSYTRTGGTGSLNVTMFGKGPISG